MRVFVAGATGAIGKQLVPRLVAAGHEVHGLTRSESKQAMLYELGAVPAVAHALDPDQVAEAVGRARPDVIVHQLTAIGTLDMRHFALFSLPVGYVYDDDGQIVMDPNEEIRGAISDAFAAFEATGSAYGVVGAFAARPFPQRAYGGAWAGEIRWGRLTRGRIQDLLRNPSYAGAYVYGRFRAQRWIDPEGVIRTRTIELPRQDCEVLIQDHYPAYITWQTYLRIQDRLAANCTHNGARPPREGAALLQGIVLCGACGHAVRTPYWSNRALLSLLHLTRQPRPVIGLPVGLGNPD